MVWQRPSGLACDDALDDPPLQAVAVLDTEAGGLKVVERVAQQVVPAEPNQGIEEPLGPAHEPQRTADVLEQAADAV
jgi:hypothetical protein